MAVEREPLLWFTVKDRSKHLWRIYLTCQAVSPELNGNAGMTFYNERRILVDVKTHSYDQDDTALHELMHVALNSAELPTETEEYVVASATPHLLYMLQKVGKLRFPPRPAGYNSLARYARRRQSKQ